LVLAKVDDHGVGARERRHESGADPGRIQKEDEESMGRSDASGCATFSNHLDHSLTSVYEIVA
jgi:hypothetical protein